MLYLALEYGIVNRSIYCMMRYNHDMISRIAMFVNLCKHLKNGRITQNILHLKRRHCDVKQKFPSTLYPLTIDNVENNN